MNRLTYKSEQFGDYGAKVIFNSQIEEIFTLRNALGRYEDTGLTPSEITEMVAKLHALEKNQKFFQKSIDK